MTHLERLQTDFQAYLIDDAKGAAFTHCIVDDTKVGVKKRLGIYYDAYRFRIIEALTTVYPKLKILLGDDLFESIARAYIDQYPSTYCNMRWYGSNMRDYLLAALPQHPIAAEMATFEWSLGLAFDAEDAPILTLQDLTEVPVEEWSDLKFMFHPSVQLLPLQWNIVQLWNALEKDETPPSIIKTHEPCLIWRAGFNLNEGLNSHFRSIETSEYTAIQLAISGASFGDLCDSLQNAFGEEEATTKASQYLSGWLNDGVISKTIN